MKEKYCLNEEDIKKLSEDQQKAYNRFLETIKDSGVVYLTQLQEFDEILQQQYRNRVLFNPNGLERYLEIFAKNINNVINTIIQIRNDVINGKRAFKQTNFQRIDEGLDVLKKFVVTMFNSPHYQNSIGYSDAELLLSKIEQLKTQMSKDISFYQGYYDEKESAIDEYKRAKEAYDELSLFGKLSALIKGKKKELTELRIKNNYYGSISRISQSQQPGDLVNPYQYVEYLERQQPEQSTGEKRR